MSVAIIQRGDRATHTRISHHQQWIRTDSAHVPKHTCTYVDIEDAVSRVFKRTKKVLVDEVRESDREREREREREERNKKGGEEKKEYNTQRRSYVPFIPYRVTADIVIAWVDLVRHRRRDRLNLLHKSIVRSFVPLNACTCNKGSE